MSRFEGGPGSDPMFDKDFKNPLTAEDSNTMGNNMNVFAAGGGGGGHHIEYVHTVVGGTDVGVQAIDTETGKVVGTAYTEFHKGSSEEAGDAVVRGRIEVDPEYRGQGIGSHLGAEVRGALAETGNITHQAAYTPSGDERLSSAFEKAGYTPRPDVPDVVEKHYGDPSNSRGGQESARELSYAEKVQQANARRDEEASHSTYNSSQPRGSSAGRALSHLRDVLSGDRRANAERGQFQEEVDEDEGSSRRWAPGRYEQKHSPLENAAQIQAERDLGDKLLHSKDRSERAQAAQHFEKANQMEQELERRGDISPKFTQMSLEKHRHDRDPNRVEDRKEYHEAYQAYYDNAVAVLMAAYQQAGEYHTAEEIYGYSMDYIEAEADRLGVNVGPAPSSSPSEEVYYWTE